MTQSGPAIFCIVNNNKYIPEKAVTIVCLAVGWFCLPWDMKNEIQNNVRARAALLHVCQVLMILAMAMIYSHDLMAC